MSAVELAAMIRGREVSSREVVQAHLDRVEAVNPQLNAIVRLLPEQALAAADAADRAVADGTGLGPLQYPVLLSPVWSQPAFPLDFDIASLDSAIATLELMRPVLPANLLGTPAAVVPAGMAEGLPVGVQVMGGKYTELRCLAVAEAIERRLGPLTPIDPVTS